MRGKVDGSPRPRLNFSRAHRMECYRTQFRDSRVIFEGLSRDCTCLGRFKESRGQSETHIENEMDKGI